MLCNERERRREETQKRSEGRYTIRGSHDLLKKSRVQPVCHIYFPHTFMGELCFPINAHAEAQWSLNPSQWDTLHHSQLFFHSVIFHTHIFPYSEQAGGYPSMHWIRREGKAASPSHKHTNTLMFTFTPIGNSEFCSSCYLHRFGQWKESGASRGNEGRKHKSHQHLISSPLILSNPCTISLSVRYSKKISLSAPLKLTHWHVTCFL